LLAQQAMPVIGVLSSASSCDYAAMLANFRKALSETGYVDRQNVTIEFADTQHDRLPALATRLVSRQVNVLVAASTPAALWSFRTALTDRSR
jgi:putative ABC transport system substrate-binding protein